MTQKIAIYEGEGSSLLGIRDLDALYLSKESLLNSDWDAASTHFILPGGRDRPYHAAFRGAGNRKIRAFVEKGGTYIGLCAGAYYASSRVEFDRGFPLEVSEERELSFFAGKAVGHVYGGGTFSYESNRGARAARIETANSVFYSYYNGGCTFIGDLTPCQILARYTDLPNQPPAIIACRIGLGTAILSGVHIEIPPDILDPEDPFLKPLIPLLRSTNAERETFFTQVCPTLVRRSDGSGGGRSSDPNRGHCSSKADTPR